MRTALNHLDIHSEETAMVGNNMATDTKGGVESGTTTNLVLTSVTQRAELKRYPYRPTYLLDSVADIEL